MYPLSFTASYEPAGNGYLAEVVVKLNGREVARVPPITDIAFYAGSDTESRLIEDTLVDWIHRTLNPA